jgi:type VI protein secretion system component Hcp
MAGDQSNEILMRFVNSDRIYVGAECQTAVDTDSDDLAADYNPGSFFAVDDFAFGMNIDDKDPAADSASTSGSKGTGPAALNVPTGPQVKFGSWKRASPPDPMATKTFPLRMDEFSITRRYDRASVLLFEKCATSDNLLSASMIKRKIVGEDRLQTFLRFDFRDVLITHIDWQDAEVIKETVKFVFRKITVQYKTQSAAGKLNAAGSVSWEYDAALRKPAKGG